MSINSRNLLVLDFLTMKFILVYKNYLLTIISAINKTLKNSLIWVNFMHLIYCNFIGQVQSSSSKVLHWNNYRNIELHSGNSLDTQQLVADIRIRLLDQSYMPLPCLLRLLSQGQNYTHEVWLPLWTLATPSEGTSDEGTSDERDEPDRNFDSSWNEFHFSLSFFNVLVLNKSLCL